jgi:hypothetical protein
MILGPFPVKFFLLLFITEAIACLNGCYAFACSKIYGVGKVKFKTKWPGILNTYLVDKNKVTSKSIDSNDPWTFSGKFLFDSDKIKQCYYLILNHQV